MPYQVIAPAAMNRTPRLVVPRGERVGWWDGMRGSTGRVQRQSRAPMRLPYALKMLAREPGRFLPAVLAVTFSAVLVSMQSGMLLGFLRTSSRPVERVGADLWVGSR